MTSGTPQQTSGAWQCYSCQLMNSSLSPQCHSCLLSKFHSTYDISGGYSHLSDNDLAAIIQHSEPSQLHEISRSLENQRAVYCNHSFLSLLIDIGRINLIFLLFNRGFEFPLNHRTPADDGDARRFVKDHQILPLSMAFERDEIYLIKLLLAKGANPNQWTKRNTLSLHYEWFDLSRHAVYVHFLPISIPIRKMRHQGGDRDAVQLAEYEEIFSAMMQHGAIWFEEDFMAPFSGQDASFWSDFLSAPSFRAERCFVHNAMKRHYEHWIKPHALNGPLAQIESVLALYFVAFPTADVSEGGDGKISDDDVFGETLRVRGTTEAMKRSDEAINGNVARCEQFEYTLVGRTGGDHGTGGGRR